MDNLRKIFEDYGQAVAEAIATDATEPSLKSYIIRVNALYRPGFEFNAKKPTVAEVKDLLKNEKEGYDSENWQPLKPGQDKNKCRWCGRSVPQPSIYHEECLVIKNKIKEKSDGTHSTR